MIRSTDSVLVIGEALIDIVTQAGRPSEEHVGGSPANVALGLGRLGIAVRLRTALGRDERGARVARHLAASGVEIEKESYVLDHTSTAIATISPEGSARYEFDIHWQITTPIELGDARVVHVGSIGCFIEPGGTQVREAIQGFAGRARVTFDPNIRPALLGDHAAVLRVTEEIAAVCDVVKLSDEDAAWLYPGIAVDEVIDRMLAVGARVVAVTLGSEGAVIASPDARVTVPPRRVQAEDTVGAGDTFMAAIVAALAEGRLGADAESLRAAVTTAAVAASITVSRRGADLPTRAELGDVAQT